MLLMTWVNDETSKGALSEWKNPELLTAYIIFLLNIIFLTDMINDFIPFWMHAILGTGFVNTIVLLCVFFI